MIASPETMGLRARLGPKAWATRGRVEALGAALIGLVFLTDLLLPLGYAGGMLYVLPAVLGLWAASDRYPVVVALVASVLTGVGFLASAGDDSLTVILNRAGAILAIGAVTIAVRKSRRSQAHLWDTEEILRGIHALASNPNLDFQARAQAVLRMGCARFGLNTGLLSKIDRDLLEVVEVVAPPGTLNSGDVVPLQGIPCARTVSATVPVYIDGAAFEPSGLQGYHPRLPLEVYIGAPVLVGRRIHGTLAFWGTRREAASISPSDLEVIKLMARWLGAEIERAEAREALAQSERQAQQAQKLEAVGRLAAGIAHDFNNLLMGMGGCASVALKRIGPASPAVPVLEELRAAVQRGAAITRQLLSFSREQGGELVEVGLDAVVRDSEQLLRRLLGEDIVLDVRPAAGDFRVALESGQLDQIVMNLAINARDAMSTEDRLTIETKRIELSRDDPARPAGLRPGEYGVLCVTDTGHGMDEATRAKVFEPFFTTKEVGKGTGLGLSTVYAIVQHMGGHIDLASEPGRGTTFTIFLPRAPDELEPREHAQPELPRVGSETILVVEDEALVRQAIQSELEPWGYELLMAENGPLALELCRQRQGSIDVVLTDMVLPHMSGTEIAARTRALVPGVHVIFMSAYPRDQLEREGRIDGHAVTLQKPFHVNTLMARLREVLGPGEGETTPDAPPRLVPALIDSGGKPTMLFVEDDRLARELSKELLEELGYAVLVAEDGQHARAQFDAPIDIIVTDLNLPDAKGPHLIQELRRRHPGLPAIVSSGASHEVPLIQEVLAAPHTAYLSKPIDIDELDRVARTLLAEARADDARPGRARTAVHFGP